MPILALIGLIIVYYIFTRITRQFSMRANCIFIVVMILVTLALPNPVTSTLAAWSFITLTFRFIFSATRKTQTV